MKKAADEKSPGMRTSRPAKRGRTNNGAGPRLRSLVFGNLNRRAKPLQQPLGMIASRAGPFDYFRSPISMQTGKQQASLDLGAGDREFVTDWLERPVTFDSQRWMFLRPQRCARPSSRAAR